MVDTKQKIISIDNIGGYGMGSLWKETVKLPSFPPLEGDVKTNVLIIGGGITGILCAYMLEQASINYILVEADSICSGVTQNTTAKITSQHGLIYNKLIKEFGIEKAKMYLEASSDALQQFRELCQHIDCNYEVKDSFVYSLNEREPLEKELKALDLLDYEAAYVSQLPLPMSTVGAIKFPNQAQFHPLKFIASISKSLHIYEHTKITELGVGAAKTNSGLITADHIIMATHFPILNKHGAYFLKMYQSRSYVLALENAQNVQGMYIDESGKGLSFRNQDNLLLLGGGGHRTGKKGGNWKELSAFAHHYYPHAKERYRWATQDCMTLDGVPYIGLYGKHTTDFYVATGFNKWGMTSSMVSAMLIRDKILGKTHPYATVFDPHRTMLHPQLFINVCEATKNLLTFSAKRCPHLGCALKWNEVEHTWDCPCHGSRFTEKGELINNPATDDLKP